ncbi:MAG: TolC family protein [Deltaproteobacteria bacterium]|nr:MAG: TolC family protein [Deltaproteobacteria bacterium]
MDRKRSAWMAAVLGTAHMAAAPPATGLRLADALVRAQAASPVVQAAAADLDAARGRLRQARLIPANPVLSADLARHSAPGEDTKDRGVQLEQEIEVGGQRGLRIAAADHDVAHAGYLLADRRRTVDGEVRRAFFGLAAADRRQQLAAERLALAARLAEAARRRARAGEVGALDVRLAELETARAEQERTAAETERSRAAARLAVAIGAPPDEPLGVETDEQTGLPEGTEQSLVARALAARPDLAAAREERARLETEAALARRRGLVPNPVLRGFYREEQLEEHIVGGGVSVPLPIWNREQGTQAALLGGARGAAVETARLEAAIPREVHLALVHRTAAEEAWRRYEDVALPAARSARELLERGYDAGYLSLPDLLLQQDRLLQTRAAAIDAWRDLREAEADVIEAAAEPGP